MGIIVGTVVDANSVSPIAGATVSTDSGGYTATTDADGSYTITDVAAGTYTLTASATDYDSASGSVTVLAGEVTLMDFILQPSAPLPCEAESIDVSYGSLSLKRKSGTSVIVTITSLS